MELLIIVSALAPIYAGAHASLSRPSSAAKPERTAKKVAEEDEEDEEEETMQKMEALTPQDAIIFPLTAAAVLGGLYWAIKTYGATVINLILGWYFTGIGVFSMGKLGSDTWSVIESFITPTYYKDQGKIWKLVPSEKKAVALEDRSLFRSSPLGGILGRVSLPAFFIHRFWADRGLVKDTFTVKSHFKKIFDFNLILTQHNVISAIVGTAAVLYSNLVAKPWWLTNIQGFAVCYGALQLMSPTSFATGSLILSGLFCYDIWAVFFTPLMVTVAKNLDVPIKMLFPRPMEPSKVPGELPKQSYSMLGLGDIVLPGIMIAMALRYDLHLFYLKKQTRSTETSDKGEKAEKVNKAPYVSATGHWGDKFYVWRADSPLLPAYLTTSFPKIYFSASMIGYVFGMITTLVAMTVSRHAQPALLYLVPGVLGSLWGTALIRGEIVPMWQFSEILNDDGEEDEQPTKPDGEENDEKDIPFSTWLYLNVFGAFSKEVALKMEQEENKGRQCLEASKSPNEQERNKQEAAREQKSEIKKPKKDENTIFSFTITRRSLIDKRSNEEVKEKGKEDKNANDDPSPSKASLSTASSDSDDGVVVGKEDLSSNE